MILSEITLIVPLALTLLVLLGVPFFLKIYSRFEELYKIVTNRGSSGSGQTVNSSGEGNPDSGGDDTEKDKKKDSNKKKSWVWYSAGAFLLGVGTLGVGLVIWWYKWHLPELQESYKAVLESQAKIGTSVAYENWQDIKEKNLVDFQAKFNSFAQKSGVNINSDTKPGVLRDLNKPELEKIRDICNILIEKKEKKDSSAS